MFATAIYQSFETALFEKESFQQVKRCRELQKWRSCYWQEHRILFNNSLIMTANSKLLPASELETELKTATTEQRK